MGINLILVEVHISLSTYLVLQVGLLTDCVRIAPVSRTDTLESERQKWHAVLDNLLEGNLDQEDMKVALSLAA